jgi:hypothetical protein
MQDGRRTTIGLALDGQTGPFDVGGRGLRWDQTGRSCGTDKLKILVVIENLILFNLIKIHINLK